MPVGEPHLHPKMKILRAKMRISLQVHDATGIVERLLGFLTVGKGHITAETLIQVKDLVRRYPRLANSCLEALERTSVEVSFILGMLAIYSGNLLPFYTLSYTLP